jgi:hypothetical protein
VALLARHRLDACDAYAPAGVAKVRLGGTLERPREFYTLPAAAMQT